MKKNLMKNVLKTAISLMLTAALLISAIPAVFAETDAEITAVNVAPNTQVYSTDYFTESSFNSNFTLWQQKKATISDGILNIAGTATTRGSAYMHNVPSLNQTASMTLAMGEGNTSNAILWLRVNSFDRGTANDNIVPTGYYLNTRITNGSNCYVRLQKAYTVDGAYTTAIINQSLTVDALSSDGTRYCDITVVGSAVYDEVANTTVINVKIYKDNTLLSSNSFEDNQPELQKAGKVGIAVNGADTSINFKGFSYNTTDSDVAKSIANISNFDSDNFAANFAKVKTTTLPTFSNGAATFANSGNNRDNAWVSNKTALNQTVSATVKAPHSFVDGVANYVANTAVIWIRSNFFTRPSNETALCGYYATVTTYTTSDTARIAVYKQGFNDAGTDITGATTISSWNIPLTTSAGDSFADVTVKANIAYDEATGENTIAIETYKGTYHFANMDYSFTDATFTTAGSAGLAAMAGGATFTSFVVDTTESAVDSAYVVENSGKGNGAMFGQVLWVDPTATYELSAVVDGDFTNEPITLAYRTAASAATKISFGPETEGVVVDTRYNKYTYTIDMSALTVMADSDGFVPVYVGFSMNDAAKNGIKYTNFELRKVTDGVVGGNLLVNGDFKMGFFGWSESLMDNGSTATWKTIYCAQDAGVASSNKRMTYYRDSDNVNYWSNFVVENYADYIGDANCDDEIDIRDLVCAKKNAVKAIYNIYADMDQDGNIGAIDLTEIRTDILESKN